eukprot:6001656-Pyramimonas_sp.AAC.1
MSCSAREMLVLVRIPVHSHRRPLLGVRIRPQPLEMEIGKKDVSPCAHARPQPLLGAHTRPQP